jgi:hypothetical protein
MGTVPLVLVRRTASPAHVFVRLRSLAALVVVRLVVVPLPPLSLRRRWRVVGWADILLDAIGGVERALLEGCSRTMTSVSQYWFSGAFSTGVFNTNALPRINIGADVWGESSIMTGVC